MKELRNLTRWLLITITGFLILVTVISFSIFDYSKPEDENVSAQFICGTESPDYSEKAQRGREIFQKDCMACHKLFKDAIGPALKDTDSVDIHNWLRIGENKIDTLKIKDWNIDYHRNHFGRVLDEKDLSNLTEYLNTD